MGNRLKKYFMFLFNLVLFLQLYSYHTFEVEAIQRESFATCTESDPQNGSTINEKVKGIPQRPKRPARLMPVQLLINDEDEDETPKTKNITDNRFYGPANNCVEIAKLGYTLNGYYLVKGNITTNSQIQVLGCKFKHFDRSKEVKEEKVGIIDIEIKSNRSLQRRAIQSMKESELEAIDHNLYKQKRPARLLPIRMTLGEEEKKTRNQNTAESRFYGPATSCDELGKLGYTLNGLYLVDCKDKPSKDRLDVIICRFKQPNGSKEVKEERLGFINKEVNKPEVVKRRDLRVLKKTNDGFSGSETLHSLGKRPVRLLPPHLFYGKEKDNTEEINLVKPMYGLPANCNDLGRIGYTLNGFYLVKGTNNRTIDIVLCRFQQPTNGNESMKEERFNVATTTTTKKPDQFVFQVFIYTANTTQGSRKYRKIPLDHVDKIKFGDSYYLMNSHGKCLLPETFGFYQRTGEKLIQNVCNTFSGSDNGNQWSLLRGDKYGGGIRLSFSRYCVSFGGYLKGASKYALFYGRDKGGCGNEKWKAKVLENGSQFVSGNHCLAIEGDSAENGRFATPAVCDSEQKGQMWSFVEFEE